MGEQNLNIRIKHKYDTEANWNKNNPVLLSGEIELQVINSVNIKWEMEHINGLNYLMQKLNLQKAM